MVLELHTITKIAGVFLPVDLTIPTMILRCILVWFYTYNLCLSSTLSCAIGAVGGVATGYGDHVNGAGEVRLIFLPEFKLGYQRYFIKSRFFPETGSGTSAAITFSIGREF